ncbi:MAG TPA: HDOD domain-containing protein, partial [Tepidisphaeraceae bacterium]|nr:HDOD domain-containing protein [Tepidisphaeraceae bacterium]
VHSAGAGVRGEVQTIDRAVLLLGFEAVRSAALAISIFEVFDQPRKAPETDQKPPFSREEFWKHSIAVACCAELLAEALVAAYGKDAAITPPQGFLCGLLHDLGKVALDAMLPKSFAKVVEAADLLRGDIADLERTVIGLDHMVVGKRLAERWKLPVTLWECIWLHGQLPDALPQATANPRLVNLVTLADVIVREQHLGYSGNYTFPIPRAALAEAVGLTAEMVDKALPPLISRIEDRAAILSLNVKGTGELYTQALAKAHQELGRVAGQLAAKNRRLAVRAKFFDALSAFQGEIRPDAPTQTILQAIGQTAVPALEVLTVGTFSLVPHQDFAEVLLFDEAGVVFETTLVDCLKPPRPPEAADGPVLSAGDELDWLLSAISPRLSGQNRFWICLEADGLCIGGVVWGGAPGEAQRLSPQIQELSALACGWALALRTAQIREEARNLAEQLADANRQLQSVQSEIQRSKMMVSIGEMAAGAAHEMNNPLMVVSGRSQLLAQELTDPKQKAIAHLINDQAHRISQIITELMDYARPTPPQPRGCEAADLLERALHDAKTLTEVADRKIEVTFGDVPPVLVDEKQVAAALTEVIDNALLATDPRTGQLTIHGAFDPYGARVAITITDNGPGMDENTLRRAFDPFFSSKPAGRRRGLGLAKAQRWIEGSGGSIKLESRGGQGTRALILLPTAPAETRSAATARSTSARKTAM